MRGRLAVAAAVLGFTLSTGATLMSASSLSVVMAHPRNDSGQQKESSKVQLFTGMIAKQGDQFILTDDTNKSSYQLDDQDAAEKFAGKKVRVKGILDAVNNTIRIQTIEIVATA